MAVPGFTWTNRRSKQPSNKSVGDGTGENSGELERDAGTDRRKKGEEEERN